MRAPLFLQIRFDGAYRRKSRCAAFGFAIELVNEGTSSRALFDFGLEASCDNSYEAELSAATRAVHECIELYTKIYLAAFSGWVKHGLRMPET